MYYQYRCKEAQIAIHEESDDPRVECNIGGDTDVVYAGNGDDATVESKEIPDPQECDVTMVPLRMRKRLSQKMIQMKMVAYWNKLKQC